MFPDCKNFVYTTAGNFPNPHIFSVTTATSDSKYAGFKLYGRSYDFHFCLQFFPNSLKAWLISKVIKDDPIIEI